MLKSILKTAVPLLLLSCNHASDLERALRAAGENRTELEKTLVYYSHAPKDSLKYKAACFLIENMAHHYYYTGEELEYKKQYYKILTETDLWGGVVADSLDKEASARNLKSPVLKYDIKEINSQYLIDNIEWAFKVRNEQPWGKNISFDDFCEYILPYRLGDEDVSCWRERVYNKFNPLLDSIRKLPRAEDPLFVSRALSDSLRKLPVYFCNHPYLQHRVGPRLTEWISGDCLEITDAATYIYRALGLPCGCDMMPLRGNGNVPHYWNFTMDKKGNTYYFSLAYDEPEMIPAKEYPHPKGKVYRETFSLNTKLANLHLDRNRIHYKFRLPHIKDVTSEYTPVEISVNYPTDKLYQKLKNGEVVYLCQASWRNWHPVAVTNYKKQTLSVPDIEPDVVYVLAVFENNTLSLISDPFYVDKNSELHIYTPRKEMTDVVVYHKYRLVYQLRKSLEGGVFEGSNKRDFSQKDTLFMITERPNRLNTYININSDREYRYVRYFGPEGGYCNIAEASFYGEGCRKLEGKIIGTPNSEEKRETHDYTNVFDGDPNTSFDYYLPYGGWAGLDLGRKERIHKLCYTARNRDNYIRAGSKYELFFFQNQTWKSAGALIAESDSLVFNNVPGNTLLYLKNHSGGTEERIFGIIDGKQNFW